MNKSNWVKLLSLLTALVLTLLAVPAMAQSDAIEVNAADYPVTEDGWYSTMEEVAVYLHTFEKLPENFLTKRDAEDLGWNNRAGNLDEVAPGCAIGGNRFGNYEGVLPEQNGRTWTECDINYQGGHRGAERICFSTDGLIYYTNDHYNSFTEIVVVEGEPTAEEPNSEEAKDDRDIKKGGEYTAHEDVAAYLHKFGKLPGNYLTRNEAKDLGWSNKKDNLGNVAPGCAIGGDEFQNREKLLPTEKGRQWYECDVNVKNGKRGQERICYSSDGLIYYTADKYKSFTQLY